MVRTRNTEFIPVSLLINYCMTFHVHSYKTTFASPYIFILKKEKEKVSVYMPKHGSEFLDSFMWNVI